MLTFLGLILLLAPFTLLFRYKNKKLAFIYLLAAFMASHFIIAVITQLFNIFNYSIIFTVHLLIFIFVIIYLYLKKSNNLKSKILSLLKYANFNKNNITIKNIKIDWLLIFILLIAFLHLHAVHYNYTGDYSIASAPEYQKTNNMKYKYPYFTDEWYAVALINNSIKSQSLPISNPFKSINTPFINLEFAFHSFVAEIILLLQLNPLNQYILLTIVSGLLIIALIYLLLRQLNVASLPAAVASLSVLYITNAANLPGLWTLIPLIIGIIALLIGFNFITANKKIEAILTSIIILLFYPPLFIFYSLALASYLYSNKEINKKELLKLLILYIFIILIIALIFISVYLLSHASGNILSSIIDKIFYSTLTGNFNPQFNIFYIIPLPILLLVSFAIWPIFKKQLWLASTLIYGLISWLIYSMTKFRLIIEYQRLVVVTAIIIIIASGIGLDYLINYLKKTNWFKQNKYLDYLLIIILISFLLFLPIYTKRDSWKKLKAYNIKTDKFFIPASPANKYLQPDDLKIFNNIEQKTFLSFPWKGTVLGVATSNYPATTRAGTISIEPQLFYKFVKANCAKKLKIAKDEKIDLVYAPKFSCPNFQFINKSQEGLYLYKIVNK